MNSSQLAKKAVAAEIRRLHLNSAPEWYANPSLRFDPPYIKDTPIFSYKFRVLVGVAAAGLTYTPKQVYDIAGGTPFFSALSIIRIDVWGQDSGGFQLKPSLPNVTGATAQSSVFIDDGVPGSRRSHLSVSLPAKDQRFVLTSDATPFLNILPFAITGKPIDMDFTIDFHVQLRVASVAPKAVANSDLYPTLTAEINETVVSYPLVRAPNKGNRFPNPFSRRKKL